jgi:hypothetical protein
MDRFSHITDFVIIDVLILDPPGCETNIIPTNRVVPDVLYAWGSEPLQVPLSHAIRGLSVEDDCDGNLEINLKYFDEN